MEGMRKKGGGRGEGNGRRERGKRKGWIWIDGGVEGGVKKRMDIWIEGDKNMDGMIGGEKSIEEGERRDKKRVGIKQ